MRLTAAKNGNWRILSNELIEMQVKQEDLERNCHFSRSFKKKCQKIEDNASSMWNFMEQRKCFI